MKRGLFLATLALPLAGCVLPPAVGIASMAIDAGSFAATGKTATDHAISGIAGQDCRVLGILEGRICKEKQVFEAMVARLEPLRPLPEDVPAPKPQLQLQLAAAEADTETSPLAGLGYLSAGLAQPAPGAAAQRKSDPATRQVAALVPVAGEGPVDGPADTRGLDYDENGQVLGVSYAFQNPLAGMDGNRVSLNGLEILDP